MASHKERITGLTFPILDELDPYWQEKYPAVKNLEWDKKKQRLREIIGTLENPRATELEIATALSQMEQLRDLAASAIPAMIKAVTGKKRQLRVQCYGPLRTMGTGCAMATPFLAESLALEKSSNQTLVFLGAVHAAIGRPLMSPLLSNADADVRANATQVIWAHVADIKNLSKAPNWKALLRLLEPMLRDESAKVRRQALVALSAMGAGARPVLPAMMELLADSSLEVATDRLLAEVDPQWKNELFASEALKPG